MFVIKRQSINSHRDFPEIKIGEIINFVTCYNNVDYGMEDSLNAKFHYDLCQYIAKRSGFTIQHFFEKDVETAIRKMNNNLYDVIAQNIIITKEYRNFLAFTIPVSKTKQILVQRKNNVDDSFQFITNQLDLANKTLYVINNSPAILRIKNLSEEIADYIFIKEIKEKNSKLLLKMLSDKEIDYAVIDYEVAINNERSFPCLDFNIDISFSQLQAWALRKNSPVLLDSLNVWIKDFKQKY